MDLMTAFVGATSKWELRFDCEGEVAMWVFLVTGTPERRYEKVGKADTAGLTKEEIDRLPVGVLWGHHTADHLLDWLRQLEARGWLPSFLVPSLAAGYDRMLDQFLAGYGKSRERVRAMAKGLREKYDDPAKRADHMEAMSRELGKDYMAADMLDMVERFDERSRPSLRDMKNARERRDYWRELMAPFHDSSLLVAVFEEELKA